MADSLSDIRMLVLDVDGVLTDAGVYIAADGSDTKRFSIKDGLGIKIAMRAGLGIAIISGHASEATVHRFRGLGVEDVIVGAMNKAAPFKELLQRRGLEPRQVAAMGDDLPDLPLLRAAGFAATVPDAPIEVRDVADLVTERRGGDGAVREVIEYILKSQGRWADVVARFAQ